MENRLYSTQTRCSRLEERHIHLHWQDKLMGYLAERGYDPFYGARPLKRLIQQKLLIFYLMLY